MLKVHVLTLGAYQVNCYIIHEEKSTFCCVIDPGYEADTILDKLSQLGLTLEDIGKANRDKLRSRKARGTLCGSGDNR